MQKKIKQKENRGKTKQILNASFGLAGCVAGACAGTVIKAGLKMITPPTMDPVVEIGYKVGEWVITGLATTAITHAVTSELTETYEGLEAVTKEIASIKEAKDQDEDVEEA